MIRLRRRLAGAFLAGLGLMLGLALVALTGRNDAAGNPQDRPLAPFADGALPQRIVVLGTSLSHAKGWPEAAETALATCFGRPVRLVRVTRPGASSDWGIGQIGAVVAEAPDLVLIEFAINDADLLDGMWLRDSRARHQEIVAGLRADLPQTDIVLMTMNPAYGIRHWMRPRLASYYALTRDLAAEMGTGLLDLYPRWLAVPRVEQGLARDGLHPDAEAAVRVVVPALTAYLGAAAQRECSTP